MMKRALILAASILATGPALADEPPVVVELFTSQSCYSCPPAEAFLGELAQRGDVLALEFHVDYWDSLNYGSAGRWKDVFSSPESTERQRMYNVAIRRQRAVYTPQMIINGETEHVGSQRRAIEQAIDRARVTAKHRPADLKVTVGDKALTVTVSAGVAGEPAGIWLVKFLETHTTQVKGGENKGKTLTNHHVVLEMRHLGDWTGQPLSLSIDDLTLADGESCAVLLQSERLEPILAAAPCPAPTS